VTAEVIRQVTILCQPFMPESSARFLDNLAVAEDAREFASLGEAGRLVGGMPVAKPQPVFPRYIAAEEEQ